MHEVAVFFFYLFIYLFFFLTCMLEDLLIWFLMLWLLMIFLVYACLCRISESGHSRQHYKYPFGSKSRWEFPASECRLDNIIIIVIIIIIITIFLKQFVCPSWYQCGLQVKERRELGNRSNEFFPWSRNAKEFLFLVKNYTDVLESNLI
jgi:hypothetical protein